MRKAKSRNGIKGQPSIGKKRQQTGTLKASNRHIKGQPEGMGALNLT